VCRCPVPAHSTTVPPIVHLAQAWTEHAGSCDPPRGNFAPNWYNTGTSILVVIVQSNFIRSVDHPSIHRAMARGRWIRTTSVSILGWSKEPPRSPCGHAPRHAPRQARGAPRGAPLGARSGREVGVGRLGRPDAFTPARLRRVLDKSLWLGVYCNYNVAAHRHCCRAQTLLGQGP
jgi:hypothetical protein